MITSAAQKYTTQSRVRRDRARSRRYLRSYVTSQRETWRGGGGEARNSALSFHSIVSGGTNSRLANNTSQKMPVRWLFRVSHARAHATALAQYPAQHTEFQPRMTSRTHTHSVYISGTILTRSLAHGASRDLSLFFFILFPFFFLFFFTCTS